MLLFFTVLGIYLVCAAGYIDTVDADASLDTARAILDRGSFQFQPKRFDSLIHAPTKDRAWVSKLGLATPILYLPTIFLARGLVSSLPGARPEDEEKFTHFFVSLVNAFVTAATVALIPVYFSAVGESSRMGAAMAWICAFATPLFPYAKSCQREPLQGLCLTGLITFSVCLPHTDSPFACAFLAGVFAGIGLLSKVPLSVPLAPLLVYAHYLCLGRDPWLAVALDAPILIALAAWLIFARCVFGGYLRTGYSSNSTRWNGSAWSTPFWRGLGKQLWRLDSGLLWFCPLSLVSVWALAAKLSCGAVSGRDAAICVSVGASMALYARWWCPTGDVCLGPRFAVPLLPLLTFLCAGIPAGMWSPTVIAGVRALMVISLGLQLVHTAVKPQQYWTMRTLSLGKLGTAHWLANLKILAHKLSGKPEKYLAADFGGNKYEAIDLRPYRSLHGLNFWWCHWLRATKRTD